MGSAPRRSPRRALAVDELHGDEGHAVGGVDVVDVDDVGVVEGGGGLGFLDKAALAIGVRPGVGRESLMATARFRRDSIARYTTPMPPSPSLARIV